MQGSATNILVRLKVLHREVAVLLQRLGEGVFAVQHAQHRRSLLLVLVEGRDNRFASVLRFLQHFLLLCNLLCSGLAFGVRPATNHALYDP